MIGLGRPFPYISNLSLSLAVMLRDPDQGTEVLARVKVPKELLGRFVRDRRGGTTFVPLEDLIAANLEPLFPGMEVIDYSFFRVTRDTDYDVSDEADDLLQAVEEELRRRRFGEVVRLEVDRAMSPRLREQLREALRIDERQVYEVEGLLDLADLWDVAGVSGLQRAARPASHAGHPAAAARRGRRRRRRVRRDARGRHPRPPPLRLVRDLGRALRRAGGRGPGRARDQADRLPDQRRLAARAVADRGGRARQAGGLHGGAEGALRRAREHPLGEEAGGGGRARRLRAPGLKTHAKCILVVRREGDGVRHYAHIGTGNYNPKTARLYTDLGLFTADPEIGADIAEMFNYLTGYSRPRRYRKVLVAPFNLQDGILREIERTIEAHSPERPARIRMKMNALLDAPSIRALYRASQAGRAGGAQRARDLRAAARGARRLGEHRGGLGRRPLPRALADLLVRAARGGGAGLHRLGRPDAAQPLQPRRAGRPGRGPERSAPSSSTCSTARWPTTPTPGCSAPTATGRAGSPDGEPRNVQRELIELHEARAAESVSLSGRSDAVRATRPQTCARWRRGTRRGAGGRRRRADPEPPRRSTASRAPTWSIVGGGYTGMWTAWFVAELEPEARVVLLEAERCGAGPERA